MASSTGGTTAPHTDPEPTPAINTAESEPASKMPAEFRMVLDSKEEIAQRIDSDALAHFVTACERLTTDFFSTRFHAKATARVACALLPTGNQVAGGKFVDVKLYPSTMPWDEVAEFVAKVEELPAPPVSDGPITLIVQRAIHGGCERPPDFVLPFAGIAARVRGHDPTATYDEVLMLAAGFTRAPVQPAESFSDGPSLIQRLLSWWPFGRKHRTGAESECEQAADQHPSNGSDDAVSKNAEDDEDIALPPGEYDLEQLNALIERNPQCATLYQARGTYFAYADKLPAALADFDAAIRLRPRDVTGYLSRANAHFASSDTAAGLRDLERCLELDPECVPARDKRARVYMFLGAWSEALKDLDFVIPHQPRSAELRVVKASAHVQLGQFENALHELRDAEQLDPHDPDALSLRGWIRSCGASDQAELATVLVDLDRCLWLDPEHIRGRLTRAQVHFSLGDYDRAISDCDQVLKHHENLGRAYALRGVARYRQQDADSAIDDLTRAIELGEDGPRVRLARAEAYVARGDNDSALADLDAALEMTPNDGIVLAARGRLHLEEENAARAVEDLSAAISAGPVCAELFLERANAFRLLGRNKRALIEYTRAINLDGSLASAYANRAQCWRDQGRVDHALRDFDVALRLEPELSPRANFERAKLLIEVGELESALPDLNRVIAALPNDVEPCLARANTLAQLERFEEARADFDRLIELQPENPACYLARANLFAMMGRFDRADADFQAAERCSPELADQMSIWRLLTIARAHHHREEFSSAIAAASEAIALDENFAAAFAIRAAAYWYSEQFVEALDDYSRVLGFDEKDANALSGRGQVYVELGEYELAVNDLDRAVALAQDSTTPQPRAFMRNGRALALAGLGRHGEAMQEIESSIRECPQNAWAQYNLGRMYQAMGKEREAAICFRLALALQGPRLTPRKRERAKAFLDKREPRAFSAVEGVHTTSDGV